MTVETNNSADSSDICLKYRLVGDVQNVGFRHYIMEKAEELSVRGWAKNESDGSVIILIAGDNQAISQMWGHIQQGPPAARVGNVGELLVEKEDIIPEGFDIK